MPFIAVTEKAFTHLVNEHYAVLQRALSAHERLERIVLSERGLDGVAGALASLIGGPAIIFDARGEVLARRAARRPFRRPPSPRSPTSCASARARATAAARARRRAGRRALALPVRARRRATAPAPARRRRPGSSRPRTAGRWPSSTASAPPGRHGRRARAAAPPRGRRHRAPPGRRRAGRDGGGRARRRRAGPPAQPFGLDDRVAVVVLSRRGRRRRPSRTRSPPR